MDYTALYIMTLVVILCVWLGTKIIVEYSIGHFEGRRNMVPKPPKGRLRTWAYTKGHKRGVKRGR